MQNESRRGNDGWLLVLGPCAARDTSHPKTYVQPARLTQMLQIIPIRHDNGDDDDLSYNIIDNYYFLLFLLHVIIIFIININIVTI